MRKIISISLLLIFLTSHLGLAVGTHYCAGMAVESQLMLGHNHLDCGMGMMEEPCNSDDAGTQLQATACCANDYASLEVTDDFNLTLSKVNVDFVIAFTYSFFNLALYPEVAKNYRHQYYPPPLEQDIKVLFQSFLI